MLVYTDYELATLCSSNYSQHFINVINPQSSDSPSPPPPLRPRPGQSWFWHPWEDESCWGLLSSHSGGWWRRYGIVEKLVSTERDKLSRLRLLWKLILLQEWGTHKLLHTHPTFSSFSSLFLSPSRADAAAAWSWRAVHVRSAFCAREVARDAVDCADWSLERRTAI